LYLLVFRCALYLTGTCLQKGVLKKS